MFEIEQLLQEEIVAAFKALFNHSLKSEDVQLQPTRREFEGTHTLVVFPFLKVTKRNPEESAKMLGEYLKVNSEMIRNYQVVKGFLNLVVDDHIWTQELTKINLDLDFGIFPPNEEKVMVEFSSPNTNKPLHLGHLRNNFLGDSVSRILAAYGYEVMKVNLINDRGIHICKSMLAYSKYGNGETPESSGLKGDHLIGKYYVKFDQVYKEEIVKLVDKGIDPEEAKKVAPSIVEAQELLKKWEEGDPEVVALWKKLNQWVFDGFEKSYQTMGISFDKVYYESDTYVLGKDIVKEGLEKEIFFSRDDGSVWIDLTADKLDEKLLLRSDGTSVYVTQDIGTCEMKHKDFPFDKSVYVVGNEQDYHFKVLFKIMEKLGKPYADGLFHLSYGMVDLPSGKMKSREGTVVDADDLMEEMFETARRQTEELGKIEGLSEGEAKKLYKTLGLGALKYFLLKVDPKKRMLFNPQESIEFQGNTGPFIQYTHARISAILRRAREIGTPMDFRAGDVKSLHERELMMIYKISQFPKAIQQAAEEYAPYLVAQYVYDLAKEYNGFYQEVSIFNEADQNMLRMRVILSSVAARIIRQSMSLLGIDVPTRM
ncbi:MAG: arginine--tRNA ligase [Cyclobacteriaceae bacterium]